MLVPHGSRLFTIPYVTVDDPPCDNIKTVLEGSLVVVSLDNESKYTVDV